MADFATTLRALLAPRRSVPIAMVVLALVAVQVRYGTPRAALVPLGMSLAFVALGPWSWRVLLARGPSLLGAGVFAAGTAAVVAVFGVVLPQLLATGPTFLTDEGSLVVASVLYCVGSWGLGRDIELEHDLAHVRLKTIRTHLDPHFLYNTLNAIMEWCAEDPRVAEEAIGRLATLLRTTLDALEQRAWPIANEIALIEDLLELHRIRDREAFTAEVACDPAVTTTAVPPLVLVTLVENAIKHGPRAGHRGRIDVRIASTPRGVRCEIENPGGFVPGRGRGLATVRSRLELAYGRRASFAIASTDGERTRAVVEIAAR
jgi:two-component system, LytTR family, sensor histidine kinase AlgZ